MAATAQAMSPKAWRRSSRPVKLLVMAKKRMGNMGWLMQRSGNLGGVQRPRNSVALGFLGQASLPAYDVKQLAESLARGRVQFHRDGTSTQVERRPACRGMQAAKFGDDWVSATKSSLRCLGQLCRSRQAQFMFRHILAFALSNAGITFSLYRCRQFAPFMVMAK